jgi:DNA repair protein RecO (recombination protein O)
LDDAAPAGEGDIAAGFALTGHFLERDVLEPHGLAMPQARERLIGLLARPSKIPA